MACELVQLPDGGRAIVCTRERRRGCIECGAPADKLCDWKVPERRSGTCDAPLCSRCATSPAPEKDLCPAHARAYQAWLARQVSSKPQPGASPDV